MRNSFAKICVFSLFGFSFFFFPIPVHADVIIPTITYVHFTQDGKPLNKPVEYTVKCYGYNFSPVDSKLKAPGTYTPVEVFSFSGSCANYACTVRDDFYLGHMHIDYCNLDAMIDGKAYTLEKYADNTGRKCENDSHTIQINGKVYKNTPERNECLKQKNNSKECDKFYIEVDRKETEKVNGTNASLPECELRFDLPKNGKSLDVVEKKPSFFASLACWIKSIFGKSC